jgi:hypothetical protein
VYDLPHLALPDEDTPAPVRFLPEYDNVLLSYTDRSRVNPYGHPIPLPPGDGAKAGTVLVEGELRGTWKWTGSVVEVTTDPALSDSENADVSREADALADFLAI